MQIENNNTVRKKLYKYQFTSILIYFLNFIQNNQNVVIPVIKSLHIDEPDFFNLTDQMLIELIQTPSASGEVL